MAEQRGARERRIVSVLFCDLVGFTDFSDGADPEDVDVLLEGYFSRARTAVESHGGVVEKFIGDAVVGVFGHPVAHDDDPERAVRAGLAIVDAMAKAQDGGGPWLPVRVGANTGEALVRRGVDPASGEGFLAGDSVNVAARIQSAAQPMTVLVGPDTHAATHRVFNYVEHPPVMVKGKAESIGLFQPMAALALVGTDLTRRHDAPFVGRDTELGALIDAFDQVANDATPVLVRVVGEPGIGKSRLVGHFLDQVQHQQPGLVWRTGRCLPYGEQAGIWALGEIVRSHLGVADTDPVDVVREKLEARLPPGPDRGWLRQRMLPLLGVQTGQPGSAAEQLAAWSRFLRDTVGAGPAVLVFEDVHWADDTLLRFVHQLVNDATDQPLMVVVTTRPEHRLDTVVEQPTGDDGDKDEERPIAAASQLVLDLSPLDEAASRALLAALLAQPSVPDELAATIMARAEGNPLFLGELVRLLRDRDLIQVDEHGAWQLAIDAEIPVPDSLHGVIAARYDLLPEPTRAVLATASVLGRTFWPAAVEAMQPDTTATLAPDLVLAAERDLITSVPSTMTGQAEYAFFHALTRDVIYATLPRDVRATGHEAAAGWLENQLGERADEIADVLAHHLATAIDLHTATRHPERADVLKPQAVHYLHVTARQIRGTDNLAAIDLYRRAADLTDQEHPEWVQLLADYSTALRDDSRFTEALDVATRAVEAGRERGDESQLARAQLALLAIAVYDPALVTFDVDAFRQEWIDRVLQLPPSDMTVIALHQRAHRAFHRDGRTTDALADMQRAVDVAEQTGQQRCAALVNRGTYRLFAGDPAGVDDLQRAIDVGRETGDTGDMCIAYINLSFAMWFVGPMRLLPLMEDGLDVSAERGYRQWAAMIATNLFESRLLAGQVTAAVTLQHHLQVDLMSDSPRDVFETAPPLASLALLTGDVDLRGQITQQLHRFDPAELSRSTGNQVYVRDALVAAAAIDDRTTFSRLTRQIRDNPDVCNVPDVTPYLCALVRTALALSDTELATLLLAHATHTNPMLNHALVHATAMIDEHTGHLDKAAASYLDVADRWEQFTNVLGQADALLGAVRCLAALGDSEQAREVLAQARGRYDAMPAAGKVAECDALLATLN